MPRPPSKISIRQMEMIWAILNHGTMAKAAKVLNISQPAISRMVKHAEDRSGLQLFERRGTRLVPTAHLQALSAEFARVFHNVDRVQRLATALQEGWGRPIRVSSMAMLAGTFLTRAIAQLRADHQLTPAVVKLNHRTGVEQDIQSDDFDIGLVHGVSESETLHAEPLCLGRVVCLLPAGQPLAGRPEVGPSDLADQEIISMGRMSPLSNKVNAVFEAELQSRRIAVQTADSRLAAQFAAEGLGIALLDPFFLESGVPEGLVVRPFAPRITTTCFAIYQRNRPLTGPETALMASLHVAASAWQKRFEALISGAQG